MAEKSIIYAKNPSLWIKDYHQYIISLLELILRSKTSPCNIFINRCIEQLNLNDNPNIRISINHEYTILKENDKYVVRINKF